MRAIFIKYNEKLYWWREILYLCYPCSSIFYDPMKNFKYISVMILLSLFSGSCQSQVQDESPENREAYAAGKLKDDYSHLLFTLCYLPLIETSFYQSLLDTSRKYPGSLVASKKNGRVMVPAIFNSSAYTELLRLSGDKGAGELLNRGKKDVVSLEATDIWMDIDKMADYESLIAREQPGKQ